MCLPTVPQATELNGHVQAYNALDKDSATTLTQRLVALKKVFAGIYQCFNDAGSGVTLWPAHDRHKALVALEQAAEAEFDKLVKACVDEEEPPMLTQPETGRQFDGEHYRQCHDTWKRIVAGKSAVRVQDNNLRLLAMLARVIDVPIGLRLVQELNQRNKMVLICESTPAKWQPHVLKLDSGVAEVQVMVTSPQQPGTPTDAARKQLCEIKVLSAAVPGTNYITVHQPLDVWNTLFTTTTTVKFTFGGATTHCKFADGGLGCVVQMLTASDSGDDNQDHRGKLVHTPGWLTLGHELGHCLTHIAGASSAPYPLYQFYLGLAPNDATADEQEKRWSNGEEYLVITVVENEFRRRVGLTERGAHLSLPSELDILVERTYADMNDCLATHKLNDKQSAQAQALFQELMKAKYQGRAAKRSWCEKAKAFIDKVNKG